MAEIQSVIDNVSDLSDFVNVCRNMPVGHEVKIVGPVSQDIAKGFSAIYRREERTMRSIAGTGAAATTAAVTLAVVSGPLGWLALAVGGLAAAKTINTSSSATQEFKALPYAHEVNQLWGWGYAVSRNAGDSIVLKREKNGNGTWMLEG